MEITCLWNRKHLKVLYHTKFILNAVTPTHLESQDRVGISQVSFSTNK